MPSSKSFDWNTVPVHRASAKDAPLLCGICGGIIEGLPVHTGGPFVCSTKCKHKWYGIADKKEAPIDGHSKQAASEEESSTGA